MKTSQLNHLKRPVTNKEYVTLAIPIVFSQMTTPLLGAVDTAVVGQLPDPVFIGGVAVGSLIFNTLYWVLGFLRVSTSGFASQAHGAKNEEEWLYALLRPLVIAALIGMLFVVLQSPIRWAALQVIQPSAALAEQASLYYNIRIWGAPFALMSYVILGWLVGSSYIKATVYLQVGLNVVNIVLDVLFVMVLNMGVAGVAVASLTAETGMAIAGFWLLLKLKKWNVQPAFLWSRLLDQTVFSKMVNVNRDLFIRSVCLLTVYTLFTSKGAQMGEVTLAANAILFQIHFIMAYLLGGIGNTSSIFVGRAVGANDADLFADAVKQSWKWGAVFALLLAVLLIGSGAFMYPLFTSIADVTAAVFRYDVWLWLFPLVGFWGITLNGVFSGATEAAPIRNSFIVSMIVFVAVVYTAVPLWGNDGLWLAFNVFTLMRSVMLGWQLPKLEKRLF